MSRWRRHTHDVSCIMGVRLLWRKESRAAETDGYAVISGAACDLGSDPTKRRERLIPYHCRPTPALTAIQFAAHASCTGRRPSMPWAIHERFVAALAISAGSYTATEAANAAAIG
jgi:hypothetical protein